MNRLQLTAAERQRLEQQLRETADAGIFRRTLAVLEVAAGRPVVEVADLLRASRASIHHWVACYRASQDPACFADRRGGNRPTVWTEELVAALVASLERRPEHLGYQAVAWTVPLLQAHLGHWRGEPLSQASIRRQLHELDYAWKRPRYVLAPDPEREKKTANSAGNCGPAAALGEAVRGRDGPAAVPAAAVGLGLARPAPGGADLRAQRPARRVRHD